MKLADLLNQNKYIEAVEKMRTEPIWDEQAISMFLTGFDLSYCNLLYPIKDRLKNIKSTGFREAKKLGAILYILHNNTNKDS